MTRQHRLPTYFISHGGGPWPYMKDAMPGVFDRLEASLKDIPRQIGITPKAILMVSGHWETREFTISAAERPGMIYDYSGFPEHTYHVKYPAPGSPDVARRVQQLLAMDGIPAHLDPDRGFDHGTFAPLAAMYPAADVPVVQLSIRKMFDPEAHIAAGRSLAALRDEGILIIGSGLSYHNLGRFGARGKSASKDFDDWLTKALSETDAAARTAHLKAWSKAPAARIAHPREDHLIPLMVAAGAALAEVATRVYHEDDFMGGITVSSFRFGEGAA